MSSSEIPLRWMFFCVSGFALQFAVGCSSNTVESTQGVDPTNSGGAAGEAGGAPRSSGGVSGSGGVLGAPSGGAASAGGASVPGVTAICDAPIQRADVAAPDHVIGTGTPESCSENALRLAVADGGVVTFDCGDAPVTIAISEPLVAPADHDTTIDGGGIVTLDGGGKVQILRASRDNWYANDRVLTVQGLTFRGGNDVGSDFVPRDGTSLCAWGYKHGGGGAIFVKDVGLHVIDCVFEDNAGPLLGPDVAGGAIYGLGVRDITIVGSRFSGNKAANGGAVGVLHGTVKLVNAIFEGNEATGEGANFVANGGCPLFNHLDQGGAGGLAGAFYIDGFDPDLLVCGVTFDSNVATNLGGAVFRSAYWGLVSGGDGVPGRRADGKQITVFDRVTMTGNKTKEAGGGGAYVNNSLFQVLDSTFSSNSAGEGDGGALKVTGATFDAERVHFEKNSAAWGGGFTHWGVPPDGNAGTRVEVNFTENAPNDYATDNAY